MISIIGASNIDICAKSDKKIILEDSNIGRVSYHVGGVGRNIAHNLALMKKQVNFFSIFADDLSSNKIFDNLNSLKINYSNSLFLKNANTPVYLFIADNDGSMICAVNDMSLLKELTPSFLKDKIDIINKSNLCIIDANLEEDSIDFLLNECKIPVLCDPVSIKKGERFLKNLDKIHTFKPNLLEALYFTKKRELKMQENI